MEQARAVANALERIADLRLCLDTIEQSLNDVRPSFDDRARAFADAVSRSMGGDESATHRVWLKDLLRAKAAEFFKE